MTIITLEPKESPLNVSHWNHIKDIGRDQETKNSFFRILLVGTSVFTEQISFDIFIFSWRNAETTLHLVIAKF